MTAKHWILTAYVLVVATIALFASASSAAGIGRSRISANCARISVSAGSVTSVRTDVDVVK